MVLGTLVKYIELRFMKIVLIIVI